MIKEYPILINEDYAWLDLPDDVGWDIDICMASLDLDKLIYINPEILDLIYELDCYMVVETNLESPYLVPF